MMNWEMLSAVGELLGSAAVLVTLVYLAIQMRQNTASTQASTRQALLTEEMQYVFRVMDDPQLSLLRFKQELSEEEKIRLSVYFIGMLRLRENLWRQYQSGVLDKATWESYLKSLRAFSGARLRAFLNHDIIAQMFDPHFISLVKDLVASTPDVDRPVWVTVFE